MYLSETCMCVFVMGNSYRSVYRSSVRPHTTDIIYGSMECRMTSLAFHVLIRLYTVGLLILYSRDDEVDSSDVGIAFDAHAVCEHLRSNKYATPSIHMRVFI